MRKVGWISKLVTPQCGASMFKRYPNPSLAKKIDRRFVAENGACLMNIVRPLEPHNAMPLSCAGSLAAGYGYMVEPVSLCFAETHCSARALSAGPDSGQL